MMYGIGIDPAQFLRMDDVLGVVRHDDLERDAVLLFVEADMLVDPVQAIGF